MRRLALFSFLSVFATTLVFAQATPPSLMNYEGVLRDASDRPLSGPYNMVFRFYSASTAGDEILVDSHTAASGGQVTVSGGLFNVTLGGGALSDGAGPGVYTSLANVFRDYGVVWLSIGVGAETLSPRVRVVSAAYALNASNLGGQAPWYFLNTSGLAQTKEGLLTVWGGIEGLGNLRGGYFEDSDGSGYANVGVNDFGIRAYGNESGGYFKDADGSGYVNCGVADRGVEGYGDEMGGHFENLIMGSYASVANGGYGLTAQGRAMGGYLKDLDGTGLVYLGYGDYGVHSSGNSAGGYFFAGNGTGQAYVGYGDRGIWAKGNFAGGTFSHPDNTTFWADVSTPTYKIHGTGTVSFVQNHPYQRDQVIVYAAPEGDEVAVYTRGVARLDNGVARVALGPTFAFVANPDVGLTAHVTPRGEVDRLWVDSIDTSELVVRGPAGSTIAFDYIVYGLRIGFEDLAVVQPKEREALLPDVAAIEASYGGREDLRAYSAGSRFRSMLGAVARDSARSDALRRAIDGDRAAVLTAARSAAAAAGKDPAAAPPETAERRPHELAETQFDSVRPAAATPTASPEQFAPTAVLLPVSEPVDVGDVLVSDPVVLGALRRGTAASDPRVVGVAVGPTTDSAAPVATYGVVVCKVDAGYGRIVPGDLLVASGTPGHAMRAVAADAGTILGKALEPLEVGAGLIKVLVMPR